MATPVQGNANTSLATAKTSTNVTFGATPTSGNLLVLFYGARDDANNATPAFTMPSGWTKVAETSPMEFHACGIAWKVSDGTSEGTITVTADITCDSWWIGVVEFNESGVTDWVLDQASANGSGANNVSSIASGSTGTLGSSVGVAAIAGTSRTNTENLSTDTGTSLAATDADFEVDASAANFIAAWLSLTATTALDATISESSGSSRMGAAIATFIEAGGAGGVSGTSAPTQADQTSTATGAVVPPAVSGTSSATQADQTSVASGTFTAAAVTGTSAATQADQTSSASGTLGATFPDAPDPMAVAQSDTEILVSYDAVAGADAYDVERDGVIVANKITDLSFLDTGLEPSTEYSYRVRAARTP